LRNLKDNLLRILPDLGLPDKSATAYKEGRNTGRGNAIDLLETGKEVLVGGVMIHLQLVKIEIRVFIGKAREIGLDICTVAATVPIKIISGYGVRFFGFLERYGIIPKNFSTGWKIKKTTKIQGAHHPKNDTDCSDDEPVLLHDTGLLPVL
jgi:hypothetical protein